MSDLNPLIKSTLELGRAQMKNEVMTALISIKMDSKIKLKILDAMDQISSDARTEDEKRYQ